MNKTLVQFHWNQYKKWKSCELWMKFILKISYINDVLWCHFKGTDFQPWNWTAIILVFHVLPWIEYYKVLQHLTMGQKAKPDFDASMGFFDDAELMLWCGRSDADEPSMIISLYPVHGVTNSPTLALQKINAIVQMNRLKISGAEANSLEDGLPWCHMKLSTKSYKAYLRPRETINHPPIHCPKWPRYPLSVFKWSTLVFDLRNSHMLPTKFSQSCPKGIPLTPEVEVISVTYNVI